MRDERSGVVLNHASRMRLMRDAWTAELPELRVVEHACPSGHQDPRLQHRVRFYEAGRLLRTHYGESESDALAQAFQAILMGDEGDFEVAMPEKRLLSTWI